MTDIHCHVLHEVDDGSDSLQTSIQMLEQLVAQGVKNVILTPHYRKPVFTASADEITSRFYELKEEIEKNHLPINVYLGREITVYKDLDKDLEDGNAQTLANGKFLLLEFPYEGDADIDEICYKVKLRGYVPVVAHIERYSYFRSIEKVEKLKESGVVIQINASPIVKQSFSDENKFVKKLLKNKLVDIVASDWHSTRTNYFKEAYEKVKAKYKEYADLIFDINPYQIIKSAK